VVPEYILHYKKAGLFGEGIYFKVKAKKKQDEL
jgi:hypothetical protein